MFLLFSFLTVTSALNYSVYASPEADHYIALFLPIHKRHFSDYCSSELNYEAVELSIAAEYAVSRVNSAKPIYLSKDASNVTLGYILIDTCGLVERTVKSFVDIIAFNITAVIGQFSEEELAAIQSLVRVYKIPTFTVSSKSYLPPSEDSYTIPSTPNALLELRGLAELSRYHGWDSLNVICEDDEKSRKEYRVLQEEGLCEISTTFVRIGKGFLDFLSAIKDRSVIVILGQPKTVDKIIRGFQRNNLSGLVLLGSSRWIDDQGIQSKIFNGHLGDLLGLRIKTFPPIGLTNMVPSKGTNSPYRAQYMGYVWECLKIPWGECKGACEGPNGNCRHKKKRKGYKESPHVRRLVDVIGAISDTMRYSHSGGGEPDKHLAAVIRHREFTSFSGKSFKITDNGLSYESYKVHQLSASGNLQVVGRWNPSFRESFQFPTPVTWLSTLSTIVPVERCDVKSCGIGEELLLLSKCCHGCRPCSHHNAGNGSHCTPCRLDQIIVGSSCVDVVPVFVSTAVTQYCAAVFSVQLMILVMILVVNEYITREQTRRRPGDKCVTGEFDKRSVRWILLLTMVVTGIAFLFVVHPTPNRCTAHIMFKVCKTLVVLIALNHALAIARNEPKQLGPGIENNKMWRMCIAILVMFVKTSLETLFFFTTSPFVQNVQQNDGQAQMLCRGDFGAKPVLSELFTMSLGILSMIIFTRELIYIRYIRKTPLHSTIKQVESATNHEPDVPRTLPVVPRTLPDVPRTRRILIKWYLVGLVLNLVAQLIGLGVVIGSPTSIKAIWLSLVSCLGQLTMCLMITMPQLYFTMNPWPLNSSKAAQAKKRYSDLSQSGSSTEDEFSKATEHTSPVPAKDSPFLLQINKPDLACNGRVTTHDNRGNNGYHGNNGHQGKNGYVPSHNTSDTASLEFDFTDEGILRGGEINDDRYCNYGNKRCGSHGNYSNIGTGYNLGSLSDISSSYIDRTGNELDLESGEPLAVSLDYLALEPMGLTEELRYLSSELNAKLSVTIPPVERLVKGFYHSDGSHHGNHSDGSHHGNHSEGSNHGNHSEGSNHGNHSEGSNHGTHSNSDYAADCDINDLNGDHNDYANLAVQISDIDSDLANHDSGGHGNHDDHDNGYEADGGCSESEYAVLEFDDEGVEIRGEFMRFCYLEDEIE